MGWSFGKSVKLGPLRVNLSTRGVGASVGVRGARVAVGPRGTYVSLGANGFRYRAKVGSSRRQTSSRRRIDVPANDVTPAHPVHGIIATASVEQLAETTPDWVLQNIQKTSRRINWFKVYVVIVAGAALWAAGAGGSPTLIAALALVPGYFIAVWNSERRTARLIYDVEDEEIVARLAICNRVGEALSKPDKLWHVYASIATNDYKRNAGASTLISRTPTSSRSGSLPHIELNIEPWCVPVGPQRLLFLPDRLLVHERGNFAAITYGELISRYELTRFIEEDAVPADSQQVGTTWKFVNKSGGPDRRFNNNRQLPILQYGRLTLASPGGLTILIESSNPKATSDAQKGLAQLQDMVRTHRPPPTPPVQTTRREDAREVRQVTQSLLNAIVVLLRYIAAADRRLADSEIERVSAAMLELSSDREMVQNLMTGFRTIKADEDDARRAVTALCNGSASLRERVLGLCAEVAAADGRVTAKERERLAQVSAWVEAGLREAV